MKYFLIFLILLGFTATLFIIPHAFAEQSDPPPVPEPKVDDNSHVDGEPFCGLGTTYQDGICIVDKTDEKSVESYKWGAYPHPPAMFGTPLKQFKAGISIDEIQCKESLTLITKHDGSPACVKEQSIPKLIERGWAKNDSVYSYPFGSSEEDYRNLEPIYMDNPNNPGELILDLDAMIAYENLSSDVTELNCNIPDNPHKEYQCFRDAFYNCQLAKVDPDIYTIEGSPIYTNVTITDDCKIYGIIDTTTDVHGDRGIIKTTCETLTDDQYGWKIKDCDALNYPEMHFNFEMQLYPQILECEKNGNTWFREKLECVVN